MSTLGDKGLTALTAELNLIINTDKCEIIHFGSKNPHLKYKISNVEIPETDVVCDLGLLVDNLLNFMRQKCSQGKSR